MAILSAPMTIPVGIALFAIVLALLIVIAAVSLSILLVLAGTTGLGLGVGAFSIFAGLFLLAHPMVALSYVGLGIAAIGLIGPNGAGKSTFMKILATLLRPTAGDVLLNDQSILRHPGKMRRVLGYMPQTVPIIPQLTAMEYLQYLSALKGLPTTKADRQIKELLAQMHLQGAAHARLGGFSGGMRQRLA
ncbi:ATP-binding cassette domain-containing protein [Lacticaseibacillus chiayiensis]|uniref:ATP-binding cassette domain-containing protein n=1 Tax=Lacticaseibacillus chiayiensis TaxID=2100821 RepID=UPI003C74DAC0